MYQISELIVYNEYFFQFFLLFVTFLFAFLFAKMMNLSSKSLFALHTGILFIFIFMGFIDYFMIIFAIMELLFLIKLTTGGNSDESD